MRWKNTSMGNSERSHWLNLNQLCWVSNFTDSTEIQFISQDLTRSPGCSFRATGYWVTKAQPPPKRFARPFPQSKWEWLHKHGRNAHFLYPSTGLLGSLFFSALSGAGFSVFFVPRKMVFPRWDRTGSSAEVETPANSLEICSKWQSMKLCSAVLHLFIAIGGTKILASAIQFGRFL